MKLTKHEILCGLTDIQLFINKTIIFRTTLADPDVIEFINTHALFWGCSIDTSEGWRVAQSVNGRRYPLLCVVCVRDHRMTVVAKSEGSCGPYQLLQRLMAVVTENEPHLASARADR